MNALSAIIIALIVLALAGGLVYFLSLDRDVDVADLEQIDTEEDLGENAVEDVGENWNTYSNPTFDFTFEYPEEAETTTEAGRAKVTYLGSDNTTGSEITDGFTFYVHDEEIGPQDTLSSIAESRYEEENEFGEGITQPRAVMRNNRNAYEFEIETALGPTATHLVIETDEERALLVTYTIMDPEDRDYEGMVDRMIRTLRLTTTEE